ncbi:MAG TPA: DUF4440 domain-containing protein [Verrucomicrobiae bacterium]|nr:DUF4440 domain-containing protein [Verrucomicrobiae bacterium]
MNTDHELARVLRQLEESIARPEVRHSPELLASLLADDFREFGSSGRVFNKRQIMDALQGQPNLEIFLDEFQAQRLAPDLALVTYLGRCKRPDSDKTSRSLRSSIWRNRNGQWQIVFHQGTPSSPEPQP